MLSCSQIAKGGNVKYINAEKWSAGEPASGARLVKRITGAAAALCAGSCIFCGLASAALITFGYYTFGRVILDTLVRANGNTGIVTTGAIINGSRSIFNRGFGIQTGSGSILTGNIISTNLLQGLFVSANTRYTDDLIDNNGGNANPQIAGGTSAGVNTCGTAACP